MRDFGGPIDVLRCYLAGMGSIGGGALNYERVAAGAYHNFVQYLAEKTEQLAAAAAIVRRAQALGLSREHLGVLVALYLCGDDVGWQEVAEWVRLQGQPKAIQMRITRRRRTGMAYLGQALDEWRARRVG